MTLTEQLSARVPSLRRFARAMTGSQLAGDAYVALLLQELAEDPSALGAHDDPTLGLYSLLCQLWADAAVGIRIGNGRSPALKAADRHLAALVPRERVAFLLHQLEGFSIPQAARILNTTARAVGELLARADADIARQIASRVLIIEDEPLIALDLARIVEGLGHVVSSIARTHREALEAAILDPPGLVLADVRLADGSSGVSAVAEILEECSPPVIFITAFPEQLLSGDRPEPTFLMSKPYVPEALQAMISQVLFFGSAPEERRRVA